MPLQEISGNIQHAQPPKKRPGPKPTPLDARPYKQHKPISRIERSYSRERKIEVLLFLIHHRVKDDQRRRARAGCANVELSDGTVYRPPTTAEASAYWKIPDRTIRAWWQQRDKIVESKARSRALARQGWTCQWPDMEKELFDTFYTRRSAGQLVQRSWFRRTSRELFQRHYPDCRQLFRYGITWRRVTKQASKLPEEYIKVVNSFLRFIRRNSQPHGPISLRQILQPNRFDLSAILNLDETPIPFEYLDGHTYNICGARTVTGKSDRSGWNKRQATLILYIFADGIQRIQLKLIFHSTAGSTGQIYKQEGHRYSKEVTVAYNETAYNNEELFNKWIAKELYPLLVTELDNLLIMDVASFHKTPAILQKLRNIHVTTALIPSGCTSLLQPLDTAVNKPFKGWLHEATEEYLDGLSEGDVTKWTVSDRRVMTTHVVAAAARKLTTQKADLIRKAFIECGISIHADGSQDHLIRIKDISSSDIDFTGWEAQEDPVIKQEDEDFKELLTTGDMLDEFSLQEEEYLPRNNYRILPIKQLKDLCKQRGPAVSGGKKVLVERLEEEVIKCK
ncbi:hypothetical protein K469DRAFT_726176 [Zopfia rhizophila CBS 207.26]|uniref:SAP domain-containing protein n=1 Tax=Zopfia rhizophila CBS 207.26 TaxID=1314779 RepID=A0A6A6E4G2_9PEZI|nr:hypothetical protein K469DRAFT_726176 [Zopfia rhizophila CBS 207.26]